jgi:hypothetical protein
MRLVKKSQAWTHLALEKDTPEIESNSNFPAPVFGDDAATREAKKKRADVHPL